MKGNSSRALLIAALILCSLTVVYAYSSYMNTFNAAYPASPFVGNCDVCHTEGRNLNSYSEDYVAYGYNLSSIANLDSDGDGFANITEINAGSAPGDAASMPADSLAPSVTLTAPASATSLNVAITVAATDAVGVTGYMVNETAAAPAASAAGWTAGAPTSYTFATAGSKTLYAWAKDAAGNVGGQSRSITVTITVPDTTAPAVTLTAPASATSLNVAITVAATDAVGVTGYMVNETATAPAASAAGWSAGAPTSYTFATAGSKTLYAWAKDAAGNVGGQSRSITVTITVPDTTAPAVTLTAPASATSLNVAITVAATDAVGVTGYMVNETATAPAASAAGWTAGAPTSYTFATAGSKTLYAWAKDAAGNVGGQSRSITVTITVPDTTAPAVTLTAPASATSLNVAITVAATDAVGVTGYMVNETATAPAASAAGWTAGAPTSYTFATAGSKTLYAWAKDAAGNVGGQSRSITVTITAVDTTAPVVTAFDLPPTSSSLTVAITSLDADDNVGVTGYLVTESATPPAAGNSNWKSEPPVSHSFTTSGLKMLYAWAKDAAGNVSNAKSASTTVADTEQDLSGMKIWEGKWFRIKIQNIDERSIRSAFLNLHSWDEENGILHSVLHTKDNTGQWKSEELPLHYSSGVPLRFFGWSNYADEIAFTFRLSGGAGRNGELTRAKISAVGLAHEDEEQNEDGESEEDGEDDADREIERSFAFQGSLVFLDYLPAGIGDSSDSDDDRPRKRGKSRVKGMDF